MTKELQAKQPIRAVELFCGIGGFRLACDDLGIKTLWANDINPLSCEVYRNVFGGNELQEGDIKQLHCSIPAHDLLTAGFPCQPFSSAGKKQGTRDPRGTLFEEIVKVLRAHTPKWFVLENVKRLLSMENGDHFATILTALSELDYDVEWRLLNATSFGLPQNRQRVVIVGTYVSDKNEPEIHLAMLSDLTNAIRHDLASLQDIEHWRTLAGHRKRFPSWGICRRGRFYSCDVDIGESNVASVALESVLETNPSEDFFMDDTTEERLKTSVFVNKLVDGVRILYNQNGGARMGYTVFGADGVAPALTASHSRHYERYKIGERYRRLTNTEYARLQGFPDEHCATASIFNQYALYGNAVPPPLAEWALQRLVNREGIAISSIKPAPNSQMRLAI